MPVTYNTYALTPAPLVNLNIARLRRDDGRPIGYLHTITLNGTIVNFDNSLDSPSALGVEGMDGILLEQKRIKNIFDTDAAVLTISSPTGGTVSGVLTQWSGYARVQSIDFPDGVWVNRCPYSVILTSEIFSSGVESLDYLESESEVWTVNDNEDGTYSVSHQLEAKGRLIPSGIGAYYDALGFAKSWVQSRSYSISTGGVLSEVVSGSGIMNLSTLLNPLSASSNYWNMAKVESVNPKTNTYSLTENFIYDPSGSTHEDFSVSVAYPFDDQRKIEVSANGKVTGRANKVGNKSLQFSNAKTKFDSGVQPNLYTRISNYIPVNYTAITVPNQLQVVYNVTGDGVDYSATYTAISGGTLVANAVDESISIVDVGPQDIFAQIQVPGRTKGTLIQNMSTATLAQRSVAIQATIKPSGGITSTASLLSSYLSKPNTDAIVSALKPSIGYYLINGDSEEYNPIKRTYSRNTSWTIYPSGTYTQYSTPGIPSGIHLLPSGS